MKKDIPLTIETLTAEDEEQHQVTSAKEIGFLLRNIAEKETRAALYYGTSHDFILTTILGVDTDGLWVERGMHAPENRLILESKKLIFVSSHNQVKIQFAVDQASEVEYQGHPAYYLPLPDSLYRLQRRENFRLSLPVAEPLRCVIPPNRPLIKQPCELTIMDISAGGAGIVCTENDVELVPGQSWECRIHLPDVGTISCAIEVKNLVSLAASAGHTRKRAGCEFKNLEGADIILLQRYITNMQRGR